MHHRAYKVQNKDHEESDFIAKVLRVYQGVRPLPVDSVIADRGHACREKQESRCETLPCHEYDYDPVENSPQNKAKGLYNGNCVSVIQFQSCK